MFKNLTNFAYQRTPKEAVGFYIAFLVLIMLIAAIMGGVLALVMPNFSFNSGVRIGTICALISSLGLSFVILKEKKSLGNFSLILLALLSGLLSLLAGGLGGLIPVAYLTTRPAKIK